MSIDKNNNMKVLQIVAVLVLSLSIISCSKEDETLSNSVDLIFGHYYGECIGESCIETFKLTDTKLFEDTNDNYTASDDYNFVELSDAKFELAQDLIDLIPEELLEEDDQIFGCPDCGDWGGIYVQYRQGDTVQEWQIDMVKESIPDYLHTFVDAINEKIALINE